MITVRLLEPGDEAIVTRLALDDPSFDAHPDEADPLEPLTLQDTALFLRDPSVRYWCAFEDDEVVGHLLALVHRIRSAPGFEVVLFEIGVHHTRRREAIGRQLMAALDEWVATTPIRSIWVLADDADATAFYEACGYERDDDQPTYLERTVRP